MGHASCGCGCSGQHCGAGSPPQVVEVEVPVEVVGAACPPRHRPRGGSGVEVPVEVMLEPSAVSALHPEPRSLPLNILEISPAEFAASFAAAARADAWERLQRESAAKSSAGAPQRRRAQAGRAELRLAEEPTAAAAESDCAGALERDERFV